MRKLYGIAEIHYNHGLLANTAYLCKSLMTQCEEGSKSYNDLKTLARDFEEKSKLSKIRYIRKVDDTKKILGMIKPTVFFIEGSGNGEYGTFLKQIGYSGEVVFLDEGYEPKNKICARSNGLIKTFNKATRMRQDKTEINAELESMNRKVVMETIGTVEELMKLDQKERESFWAEKIDKKFKETSILLTGKAHQVKISDGAGFLPEFLKERGIELEVAYEDPNLGIRKLQS